MDDINKSYKIARRNLPMSPAKLATFCAARREESFLFLSVKVFVRKLRRRKDCCRTSSPAENAPRSEVDFIALMPELWDYMVGPYLDGNNAFPVELFKLARNVRLLRVCTRR